MLKLLVDKEAELRRQADAAMQQSSDLDADAARLFAAADDLARAAGEKRVSGEDRKRDAEEALARAELRLREADAIRTTYALIADELAAGGQEITALPKPEPRIDVAPARSSVLTWEAVLSVFEPGKVVTAKDVAHRLNIPIKKAGISLANICTAKKIHRVGMGQYSLKAPSVPLETRLRRANGSR